LGEARAIRLGPHPFSAIDSLRLMPAPLHAVTSRVRTPHDVMHDHSTRHPPAL